MIVLVIFQQVPVNFLAAPALAPDFFQAAPRSQTPGSDSPALSLTYITYLLTFLKNPTAIKLEGGG